MSTSKQQNGNLCGGSGGSEKPLCCPGRDFYCYFMGGRVRWTVAAMEGSLQHSAHKSHYLAKD
jgi:hypothetical protein